MFLSAFILDNYGDDSFFILNILGESFFIKLPGYLIVFEIAAISFIFSGYFLSLTKDRSESSEETFSFSLPFLNMKQKLNEIFSNRFLPILITFNIIVGLVQVMGNSYYGIFIYQNYKNSYFGGFLNIAIVFLIGVFSSLIGYYITKINTRSYGPTSMLVIGGFFLSSMPLAYYIGGSLALLTAGTILGVIGASAIGISINMFVIEIMHEQDRRYYYIFNGLFSIIPYIILVPIFSYVAQKYSLNILFLVLSATLIISTIAVMLLHKLLAKELSNISVF